MEVTTSIMRWVTKVSDISKHVETTLRLQHTVRILRVVLGENAPAADLTGAAYYLLVAIINDEKVDNGSFNERDPTRRLYKALDEYLKPSKRWILGYFVWETTGADRV